MTKHTKRFSLLFCTAILAAACAAPAASAAVSLTVSATHSPSTVFRGDEYMTFPVTVKNTGDTPTVGTTNVNIALAPGMFLDTGTGPSWACFLTAETCTYSGATVAAGGNFPVLNIRVFIDPETIPATPTVTFSAFGGGATAAGIGQRTFTLGPPLTFGLVANSLAAGACSSPPPETPPTSAACQSAGLGDPFTQAGGHPFGANTAFNFTKRKIKPIAGGIGTIDNGPFEHLRDGAVNLPPGFVANPTVIAGGCKVEQVSESKCPERFAIGRTFADLGPTTCVLFCEPFDQRAVVYKVESEDGYPAEFAFRPVGISPVTIVLRPKIRPGDFTVTAFVPTPPQTPAVYAIKYFTLCSYGAKVKPREGSNWESPGCKAATDPDALSVPFITNPTRCDGQADVTSIDLASYQHPGSFDAEGFPDLSDSDWKTFTTTSPPLTGCNSLEFDPSFEGRPTTSLADAPTGLDFKLHISQDGLVDPNGLATPHLKDTTVTLPEGMTVNPSAATGLEACSTEQMGLLRIDHPTPYAIRFDGKPVRCPEPAKIGNVTVTSPLLDQTLEGSVYLAKPFDNPFDSLLAIYLVVRNDEIGLSAKLAGKVSADPRTGQLTAVFTENPQLPFGDLHLEFFRGARASLRTPATCGLKTTNAEFIPWSAPESGPPAVPVDSFEISSAPGGGRCATGAAELPNAPRLSAGTVTPKAGAYSPFVFRLSREDGSQELKGLSATLPPGLTGRLAGVPYCSEAAIEHAKARSRPGQGADEQADPSCPASSRLGSVAVTAGAGPLPYHATGRAYLAGPYQGAPVSLVVITPAVAGPFDLGSVVIRNALRVNPVTAQVSVASDPIPTILEGIPLDVRSIEVKISRDRFTLNPTSCEPMSIDAIAVGLSSSAALSDRFQVGECDQLGFRPGLKLRLRGGTRRGAYQRLTAVVTGRPGDANIANAAVTLPHSSFLAQEHIRTVCTRVQFAAKECPAGSVYGHATAVTPLLDAPLTGPVYLRSSSNSLPDLVAALRGPDSQPVEVELSGRTDSKNGGIRNTFDLVPDAPVTKFTLDLLGGKKSLIVNSRNLCAGTQRATVRLRAHNGKALNFRPVLGNDCKKRKKDKKGRGASAMMASEQLYGGW
jgi:hypothetical protein